MEHVALSNLSIHFHLHNIKLLFHVKHNQFKAMNDWFKAIDKEHQEDWILLDFAKCLSLSSPSHISTLNYTIMGFMIKLKSIFKPFFQTDHIVHNCHYNLISVFI